MPGVLLAMLTSPAVQGRCSLNHFSCSVTAPSPELTAYGCAANSIGGVLFQSLENLKVFFGNKLSVFSVLSIFPGNRTLVGR